MSFFVGVFIAWLTVRLVLSTPDIPTFIYRTRLALRGENPNPQHEEEDE